MSGVVDQASASLQSFIDEVHSFCLHQISAIRAERAAKEKQRQIAMLRDNLSYRLASVRWHYNYLRQLHMQLEAQFLPAYRAEGESTSFLLRAVHQVYFVFDDLIFNLVSCFDYIARLIGVLTVGQKGVTLKWSGLVKSARSCKPALARNGLAQLILDWEREFVDPLQKYRGDLVHRKRIMGAIEASVRYGEGGLSPSVVVGVPDTLAKVLTGKRSFNGSRPPDVLTGSATLVERAVECASALMRATKEGPNAPLETAC